MVGPKVLTLGLSLFHKYSNPSKIFRTVFLFARVLSAILGHIGGVRAQKPLKKGYFLYAEWVCKILEIFNLTTTNGILLKLTLIMYHHESINQKAFRARNLFI